MDIKVYPEKLNGTIDIVSSKSLAHRNLICAALSDEKTEIKVNCISRDIESTIECIKALGVSVKVSEKVIIVEKLPNTSLKQGFFDCGESGSTLRFLLPVACALGVNSSFSGCGRLPRRPVSELTSILSGCSFTSDSLPFSVSGQLRSGDFYIKGNISSQYISGLLFALPLLRGDSRIILTSALESAPYVEMTISVLQSFGIVTEKTEYGYFVRGGQKYVSPKYITVEGDWSNAAFYFVAAAIGNNVSVTGLVEKSLQGDKKIIEYIDMISNGIYIIDVGENPDLVPILAVYAAYNTHKTTICGAARLRIKESDRLMAMRIVLNNLGAKIRETADGLIIDGKGYLCGGDVDGYNDHRIVMSAAIAATRASAPVIIRGAEAVEKSYPNFFEDFKKAGGKFDVV